MHLIRRAAFRAATSTISKPRSITTSSSFLLRPKVQNSISSSVFRRFSSGEANSPEENNVESANGEEHGAVRSALDSVTESGASTYASDGVESLTKNAEKAKDSIVDAAAAATGVASKTQNSWNSKPAFGQENTRRPSSLIGARELTPTPSIYIGNILFDVTPDDLTREFSQFGTIKNAIVATDARGLSKGFGYVEFSTVAEATAAIEGKHQALMDGRRLVVNYMAKTKREEKPNPPSKTLFIGNLAFEMSDADLNKLFREIRNVIDVRVAIDRRTGQPRGFAHADFVDVESAIKGFDQLHGKEIYGRKLRIDYSPSGRARTVPPPAE